MLMAFMENAMDECQTAIKKPTESAKETTVVDEYFLPKTNKS